METQGYSKQFKKARALIQSVKIEGAGFCYLTRMASFQYLNLNYWIFQDHITMIRAIHWFRYSVMKFFHPWECSQGMVRYFEVITQNLIIDQLNLNVSCPSQGMAT